MRRTDNDKPNILLIMTDQHRADWFGPDAPVQMPHLEALAARGTVFSRCVTNSPRCAPARVSLATGMDPCQTGVLENEAAMRPGSVTWFQRLRDAGYRTGIVGKLDLNKPARWNGARGDRPDLFSWGFTHPIEIDGKMHAAYPGGPYGPYAFHLQEKGLLEEFKADYALRKQHHYVGPIGARDSQIPDEDFADTWIGTRAKEWIAQIGDDFPWFLHVSFVGPHDPYDPPKRFADEVRDLPTPEAIPLPQDGTKPEWIQKRARQDDAADVALARRQYAASLLAIDEQIGHLTAQLESMGELENTIIAFTSDHGDFLGDHGLWQKSAPYRGATDVPLFVTGPGVPAGERREDALVELRDVGATLCDLAQVDFPEGTGARSFVPTLQQGSAHRRSALSISSRFATLITERYKVIRTFDELGFVELYDLLDDPDELVNLAPDRPELVTAMLAALDARLGH